MRPSPKEQREQAAMARQRSLLRAHRASCSEFVAELVLIATLLRQGARLSPRQAAIQDLLAGTGLGRALEFAANRSLLLLADKPTDRRQTEAIAMNRLGKLGLVALQPGEEKLFLHYLVLGDFYAGMQAIDNSQAVDPDRLEEIAKTSLEEVLAVGMRAHNRLTGEDTAHEPGPRFVMTGVDLPCGMVSAMHLGSGPAFAGHQAHATERDFVPPIHIRLLDLPRIHDDAHLILRPEQGRGFNRLLGEVFPHLNTLHGQLDLPIILDDRTSSRREGDTSPADPVARVFGELQRQMQGKKPRRRK